MDALILAAFLVVVTAWVALPLYRSAPPVATADPMATIDTDIEAARDDLLAELRELEIDHASGLVAPVDYAQQRADLEAAAARLSSTD